MYLDGVAHHAITLPSGYRGPLCDNAEPISVGALNTMGAWRVARVDRRRSAPCGRPQRSPDLPGRGRQAVQHEATRRIAEVVGKVTAVILIAYLGDFSEYASAAALEKACGLNLKITSSGNVTGRPSITKRGASETRAVLYLAAMRLVKSEPLIAAWYRARSSYRGERKMVALVAVMRKLVRALWHVARGASFDASKLVDVRALGIASAPPLAHGADSHSPAPKSSASDPMVDETRSSAAVTGGRSTRQGSPTRRVQLRATQASHHRHVDPSPGSRSARAPTCAERMSSIVQNQRRMRLST